MVGLNLCAVALLSIQSGNADYRDHKTVEESQIQQFFSQHIKDLSDHFYQSYGSRWNPEAVVRVDALMDEERNENAYLVVFRQGYLGYDSEYKLLCINSEGKPYSYPNAMSYAKGRIGVWIGDSFYDDRGNLIDENAVIANGHFDDNIYYPFPNIAQSKDHKDSDGEAKNFQRDYVNTYRDNNFTVIDSAVQIPLLSESSDIDSSHWNEYMPICIEQGQKTDCATCASVDLLFTYKLSGKCDLTKGLTVTKLREKLEGLQKWQQNIAHEGTLPSDFVAGMNDWISDSPYRIKLSQSGLNFTDPFIGLYSNVNVAGTAHYAMTVGRAKSKAFWFFNTYWRIIVSWKRNYNSKDDVPWSWWYKYLQCFYLVDEQYVLYSYVLTK